MENENCNEPMNRTKATSNEYKFCIIEKVFFLPETRLPIDWRILEQAPHGETHPPVAEKKINNS